ncbi:MAG: hypothetical protein OXR67_17285 [Chloroflexota bacterium]|nr:hypothetical protein [Chloroflexota bacterium]
MAGQGMNEVATELLRRSRDGKIAWKQTRRDNEYRVSFPDVSLTISSQPGLDIYRLDLINETGSVTESLEWNPFYSPTPMPSADASQLQTLKEIYGLAEAYVQEEVAQRALQYLKET